MNRRQGLWVLGIAAVVLFVVLGLLDLRMQDTGGPGIVGLELAGSTDRATQILGEWGQTGRDAAQLSLWIDFLFLIAYGAFLSLAILAVRDAARRNGWDSYARYGAAIAVLPIVAAVCDALEDVGLLLILDGHGATLVPQAATAFALAKFATLAVALAYLLAGLTALARARLSASS